MRIIVNNVYCQIFDLNDQNVIEALDSDLSYFVHGYQFMKAYKSGYWDSKKRTWVRWDGKQHLLDGGLKFQTGLLSRVIGILNRKCIKHTIDDKRKPITYGKKIKLKNIESREYQDRVVDACLKNDIGIVRAATGSGKSVMMAKLIANTNVKSIIYVTGIDLLYQMKETLNNALGCEIGIIGDGIADIKKINICTVWTAANALDNKYVPFDDEDISADEDFDAANKKNIVNAINNAEMVVFDECHMLAAKTLQIINSASKNAYKKIGMSGTPYRDDNADLLLEAVCGKQIIDISASELIHNNFLVQPTIHFIDVPQYDNKSENYQSIYKQYVVENDIRNDKIVKAAEKLSAAGRKVLILVKNIKHGDILLDKLDKNLVIYFVKGNLDSDERNRIRQDFIKNKIDIIIASVVYDQGVDLPNLDALILAGSGKSSTRSLQRIGRVIRPAKNKKDAIVIDFIDNAKYLLEHSQKRMDIYKLEAGFNIRLPKKDGKNDDISTNKTEEKKTKRSKVSPNKKWW